MQDFGASGCLHLSSLVRKTILHKRGPSWATLSLHSYAMYSTSRPCLACSCSRSCASSGCSLLDTITRRSLGRLSNTPAPALSMIRPRRARVRSPRSVLTTAGGTCAQTRWVAQQWCCQQHGSWNSWSCLACLGERIAAQAEGLQLLQPGYIVWQVRQLIVPKRETAQRGAAAHPRRERTELVLRQVEPRALHR